MSAAPAELPVDEPGPNGVIAFTPRGEAALDQLATALVARCSGTPEGIAKVLDQVMHAELAELADALSAITGASEQHTHASDLDVPAVENPDAAAQRRLGRRGSTPPVDPAGPERGVGR